MAEVPQGSLASSRAAYQQTAGTSSSAGSFAGRENDAATLVGGGVKARAAGWVKGPGSESHAQEFHGRENDAATAVKSIRDMKDHWQAKSEGGNSFAGRENDAASVVRGGGGIKDRVSQWQSGAPAASGASEGGASFQGRENDAAAAVGSSRVRMMTNSWASGEHAPGSKQEWKGRENDAAQLLAQSKASSE